MPSTFLELAIKLTEILGRIHAANVIHKDINPGNIVLNLNTGVVKMIDFWIATRFSRTNPTKSLHLLEGTLAYLSEQTGRMNRMLDYRSDFYSLGATFYELTGQLPFPTRDILELVHCHIAKPPVPAGSECKDSQTCFRHDFETDGEKCGGSLSECLGHQSRFRTLPSNWKKLVKLTTSNCLQDVSSSFTFLKTVWTRSGDWRIISGV